MQLTELYTKLGEISYSLEYYNALVEQLNQQKNQLLRDIQEAMDKEENSADGVEQ